MVIPYQTLDNQQKRYLKERTMQTMKFNLDKQLLKICIYVVITAFTIYLGIHLLQNFGFFWTFFLSTTHMITKILKPLFIGVVIAYFLWSPVFWIEHKLEKNKWIGGILKKKSTRRGISVLMVYLLLVFFILTMIVSIYVMIGGELSKNISITAIAQSVGQYLTSERFDLSAIEQKLNELNIPVVESFRNNLSTIVSNLQLFLSNSITNIVSSAINIGSNVISIVASIILSIYLLLDKEYFLELWNKLFFVLFRKSRIGQHLKNAFYTFDETFNNYIKGQLLEAFFVGIMSIIVLLILNVKYAVIIGMFAGITNMIPYVGPWIGTLLAALVAFLNGDFLQVLWIIIAMQIVQQIDNNLLAPKVVGDKVGLHAVFTMIAILIGGNLGGLLGMLIAVPIFASVKNLLAKWYENSGLENERLTPTNSLSTPSNNEDEDK